MRHTLLALSITTLLAGCTGPAATDAPATTAAATAGDSAVNAKFDALSKKAVDTWMRHSPVSATQTGDHRFDSELDDLSAAGRKATLDANKALLVELDAIDTRKLARQNQVDAALLRSRHLGHGYVASLGVGSAGVWRLGR